jgi:hypothetical protein
MTNEQIIQERLIGAQIMCSHLIDKFQSYDCGRSTPKTLTAQEIVRRELMTARLETENNGFRDALAPAPASMAPRVSEVLIACMISAVLMIVVLMAAGVL